MGGRALLALFALALLSGCVSGPTPAEVEAERGPFQLTVFVTGLNGTREPLADVEMRASAPGTEDVFDATDADGRAEFALQRGHAYTLDARRSDLVWDRTVPLRIDPQERTLLGALGEALECLAGDDCTEMTLDGDAATLRMTLLPNQLHRIEGFRVAAQVLGAQAAPRELYGTTYELGDVSDPMRWFVTQHLDRAVASMHWTNDRLASADLGLTFACGKGSAHRGTADGVPLGMTRQGPHVLEAGWEASKKDLVDADGPPEAPGCPMVVAVPVQGHANGDVDVTIGVLFEFGARTQRPALVP